MSEQRKRDPFKLGIVAGRELERKHTAEVVEWARAVVREYELGKTRAAIPFLRIALAHMEDSDND